MRFLSKKDIKKHYFLEYFKQNNEALKANQSPLSTNIFLNQFFEEIFDYLIQTLRPKNIESSNIWKLRNLNSLYLIENQLSSLPKEIGQLENLKELDLSFNQLTNLPVKIGQLRNLKSLNLSANQLTETEQQKIKNLLPNCEIVF
jgi:Leucine-rich repeat (LRR) protein